MRRSRAALALGAVGALVTLTGCGLFAPQQDARTSIVVGACDDALAAVGEERAARIFVADQTGSSWRLEMWQADNDAPHARPDHTCVASLDEEGFVTIESLR